MISKQQGTKYEVVEDGLMQVRKEFFKELWRYENDKQIEREQVAQNVWFGLFLGIRAAFQLKKGLIAVQIASHGG